MKIKSRMTAALTAVFLCLPVFTLPAYAQSTEPKEEPPAQEETTTAKPFTPEGTGTCLLYTSCCQMGEKRNPGQCRLCVPADGPGAPGAYE